MSMNQNERQYIEYRPRFGLVVNIRAMLEAAGQDPEAVYEAPVEIMEATQNLASDVIENGQATIRDLDDLLDAIEKALSDELGSGVSIQDLKANLGDPELRRQWDEYHANNLDGSLAGELYPLLMDAKDNLNAAMDFLNKELFGGIADLEDVDEVRNREAKEVEAIIRQDIKGEQTQSLAPLKSKTEIVQALTGSVTAVQNFVNGAKDTLSRTVNDMFAGQVESVIYQLAGAPASAISGVQALSEVNFNRQAFQGNSVKDGIERLSGGDVQEQLLEELSRLREMKLNMESALSWMDSIDTNLDSSPVTYLISDNIRAVQDILEAYDDVLADVHKKNLLQDMQYTQLLGALGDKEVARQTNRTLDNMQQHFDFDSRDRSKQVSRFVDNAGLKR